MARYLVAFFLTLLMGMAGAVGYAGHKAKQSFDTDIKNITAKYPMVHINNYQYHQGLLNSSNDFEVVLGCDNGTDKDKQIRLKIQNTINHFPISLHGLRSAQVTTSVLPNDDITRKIAEKAHLSTLATAVTDVDFDGGYHSTVKVPSGQIEDTSTAKGNIHWDEISYKIDKQSKENPNYHTEFHVPKITISANDSTKDFKAELINLIGNSESEQTEQQTLPTKSDGKNHIDSMMFSFKDTSDSKTDVVLKLANYDETTQIRSKDGLVNLTSHTKIGGGLNSVQFDNIELNSELNNIHYDSANKIAEQFNKMFSQCQSDSTSLEPLINTLKNSVGELSKHQPALAFNMTVSENGNKGSLQMAQQLGNIFKALDDSQGSKPDPKSLMDGNRTSFDIPKVWIEKLQNWLGNENSSTANKSADFEKSLIDGNFIKVQNGHYLSTIEIKQGDIFVNGKKVENLPTANPAQNDLANTSETMPVMGEDAVDSQNVDMNDVEPESMASTEYSPLLPASEPNE